MIYYNLDKNLGLTATVPTFRMQMLLAVPTCISLGLFELHPLNTQNNDNNKKKNHSNSTSSRTSSSNSNSNNNNSGNKMTNNKEAITAMLTEMIRRRRRKLIIRARLIVLMIISAHSEVEAIRSDGGAGVGADCQADTFPELGPISHIFVYALYVTNSVKCRKVKRSRQGSRRAANCALMLMLRSSQAWLDPYCSPSWPTPSKQQAL